MLILKWFFWGLLVLFFLHLVVLRVVRHLFPFPAPAFATWLIDNPFRRRFIQNPGIIADRMGLTPGMTVLDIGPGKGSYTLATAERVRPGGTVYAVDIQEAVIRRLQHRLGKERVINIIPQREDVYHLSFTDESFDRVLMVACLPEIPEKDKALREIRRVLKPEGLLCLCELFPDPDYPLRRTEKKWAGATGLELKQEYGNWFTYQLHFGKSPGSGFDA